MSWSNDGTSLRLSYFVSYKKEDKEKEKEGEKKEKVRKRRKEEVGGKEKEK